ncbi:MAG: carbonic anhydrase, partial [Ktedonobacterales bacterium]
QARASVAISVNAHASRVVAIAGHYDCAAFAASQEEHAAAVQAAMRVIAGWGMPVRVIGLWVNDWWQVVVVADSDAAARP